MEKKSNFDLSISPDINQDVFSLCPNCNINYLHSVLVRKALSRKDNKTYICDDCGQAEAMKDYEAMLLKEIKGHE